MILWGYGRHSPRRTDSGFERVHRRDAEPFYFGDYFFCFEHDRDPGTPPLCCWDHDNNPETPPICWNYYLNPVALTPVLVWYPADGVLDSIEGYHFADKREAYGYVRYLFDKDSWASSTAQWPVYDLFCAGHAFLPDGRLFIAGGNTGFYNNLLPVSNEGSVGPGGLRLFTPFESSRFTRSGLDAQLGVPNTANGLWRVYEPVQRDADIPPEPRWYPSVVALPSGRILIVGGIRFPSELTAPLTPFDLLNPEGGDREGETWYFEWFDPCTDQYLSLIHI